MIAVTRHEAFALVYTGGWLSTTAYLTFFDGYVYTWWNWPIALSANMIAGMVWPVYWLALRWLVG